MVEFAVLCVHSALVSCRVHIGRIWRSTHSRRVRKAQRRNCHHRRDTVVSDSSKVRMDTGSSREYLTVTERLVKKRLYLGIANFSKIAAVVTLAVLWRLINFCTHCVQKKHPFLLPCITLRKSNQFECIVQTK